MRLKAMPLGNITHMTDAERSELARLVQGRRADRLMLREVAEYPNSFGPLGPQDERIETPRYTLCMGAGLDLEHGAAPALPRRTRSTRCSRRCAPAARARAHATQWEVGSAARRRAWSSCCSSAGSSGTAIRTPSRSCSPSAAAGRPESRRARSRRSRSTRPRTRCSGRRSVTPGRDRRGARATCRALARLAEHHARGLARRPDRLGRNVRGDRARPAPLRRRDRAGARAAAAPTARCCARAGTRPPPAERRR